LSRGAAARSVDVRGHCREVVHAKTRDSTNLPSAIPRPKTKIPSRYSTTGLPDNWKPTAWSKRSIV